MKRLVLLLVLLPLTALAGDRPDADPRWHPACESTWLDEAKDNPKMTVVCVDHWLIHVYSPGWTAEDLDFDPYPQAGPDSVSYGDLKRTEAKLARACPWDSPDDDPGYSVPRCKRAREGLGYMLVERLGMQDHRAGIPISFDEPLKAVLAGKPLTQEMLEPGGLGSWSEATLRLMRNAAFARHGRPFRSADLTDFFYGPLSSERFGRALRPDPEYVDSRLTDVDRANVALVQAAEAKASR